MNPEKNISRTYTALIRLVHNSPFVRIELEQHRFRFAPFRDLGHRRPFLQRIRDDYIRDDGAISERGRRDCRFLGDRVLDDSSRHSGKTFRFVRNP